MLVLTRKTGEDVVVPTHNLRIRVLRVQGDRVKIGIMAPEEVKVYRQEVLDRVKTEAVST